MSRLPALFWLARGLQFLWSIPILTGISIQKMIFQLNSRERAMLIDLLWESLDEARMSEIEEKWASESEDRIDAFERGELPAVDGAAALQELRSSLRK